MTTAVWTVRLGVLILVVPTMLAHCSSVHAQDKDTKKQPDSAQPKQKQDDVILKALEENRLAFEGLKTQIAKLQAGLPQATGAQKDELKMILKALEENRLAIEGLKSEFAKTRAGAQATGTQQHEITEILKLSQQTRDLIESSKSHWIRDWGPLFVALLTVGISYKIAVDSQKANRDIAVENQRANKDIAEKNLENAKDIAKQSAENAQAIAQQSTDMARKGLQEKAREEERKRIREKIDGFYGPFLLLRKQSEYLYHTFFKPLRSAEELEAYKDDGGEYRTIIALLKGHKFQGVDAWLLRHIIDIGKQCAMLIESQTGMVDGEELRTLLAKAKTHYWIIGELFEQPDHRIILQPQDDAPTKEGKLKIHDKVQEEAKFPRILSDAVKKKQEELEQKLKELSQI